MSVVRAEDLDARLRELLKAAAEAGREAERAAQESDRRLVARRLESKPDLADQLLNSLREALEDEVLVAKQTAGEAVIEEREREREIAKRALAHIKLPRLREIADDLGLPRSGDLEEVADRIVRAYRADEEQIARLILEYETEPPPERRITTRIFGLLGPPEDLDRTADRVARFAGRYIRVGIAKWFVIDRVERSKRSLLVTGAYRAYRADADREENERYRLRAEAHGASALLRIMQQQPFVRVDAKEEGESRGALTAFLHASNLKKTQGLPLSSRPSGGELFSFDPRSIYLLDLLRNAFRSQEIEIFNLTAAGFETGEEVSAEEEPRRPRVQSVRLQGQHLLDSRPACELLAAGQALVNLSLLARFRLSAEQDVLLPVTVRLERDHAVVFTGFGAPGPDVATALQQEVLRGLEATLRDGVLDWEALERLAAQIRQRAEQESPVEEADLFVSGTEAADA